MDIKKFLIISRFKEEVIIDVESNSPQKELSKPLVEKLQGIPSFMGLQNMSESSSGGLFSESNKRRAESPPPGPAPKFPALIKQESASGEDSNPVRLKIRVYIFFNGKHNNYKIIIN